MTRILRIDGITGMEAYLAGVDARLKTKFAFKTFPEAVGFIRGPLVEAMQESFVLHDSTAQLMSFYSQRLFSAVREAVLLLDDFLSSATLVEIVSTWHVVVLTDAALAPYSTSIRSLFEEQFVKRILRDYEWPKDIKSPGEANTDQEIALLNGLVDFVNILRSCPQSILLKERFSSTAPEALKIWTQTVL